MALRIINWNCGGILNKNIEILRLINDNPDVICISETKLNSLKQFSCPPNFNLIRKDRGGNSSGGGLVTYIRSNLQFEEISCQFQQYGIEIQGLKIFKGREYLNVFNVYIPPAVESLLDLRLGLNLLFQFFSSFGKMW